MTHHLAALAAGNPGHVSNVKYATETWTPGGTILAAVIIIALIALWLKAVPGGRKAKTRPAPSRSRGRASSRRGALSRR